MLAIFSGFKMGCWIGSSSHSEFFLEPTKYPIHSNEETETVINSGSPACFSKFKAMMKRRSMETDTRANVKMEVEVSENGTDVRNLVQSSTQRKTSKPPANQWT